MNKPVMKIQLTSGPLDHLIEMGEGIDVRLDEERWQVLQVGDIIEFEEDPSAERAVGVEITDLHRYTNFQTLHANHKDYLNGTAEEFSSNMYRWWHPNLEDKHGVLAITVKVI